MAAFSSAALKIDAKSLSSFCSPPTEPRPPLPAARWPRNHSLKIGSERILL